MANLTGTYMARLTDDRRKVFQLRQYVKQLLLVFTCLVVAGCVANSTLPSQNIGTLLTPETPSSPAKTDSAQAKLATAQLAPAEQPTTAVQPTSAVQPNAKELSPAVKNSLAPEIKPDAATNAASLVTKKPTAPPGAAAENKSTPTAKVETKQATTLKPAPKPAAKPAAKPKAAPEQPKSLLAALTRNNEANRSNRQPAVKKQRKRPRVRATLRKGKTGLPGVRLKNLFGIDSNETEEFDEPVRLASVTNLARRGKHGLLIQRPDVKVGCFPPKLVRILKLVGRKFGRTTIVTSGYRSRSYNRRVGGARKSTHVRCMAADIQLKGISKWKVAKYLRTISGRGGVGTYCHTNSVHIDIGTKRAWHHCKRRRRSRRRKS